MSLSMEARHLPKTFGSGRTAVRALDDVTLHIEKGEVVLLMGPSGSGKTTLLMIMGALLKPTTGAVLIQGTDLTKLTERELPGVRIREFGFVFQSPNLLSSLTTLENVEITLNLHGRKGRTARSKASSLLIELSLGDRLDHHPDELSGGEQQRVAIARALANDPSIIIADEPTANLDSESGRAIVRRLRLIAKEDNRSVIIATHDPRVKEYADRTLWLEDGVLRAEGSPIMAVDPVCQMLVDKDSAHLFSDFRGQRFFFCSESCKLKFDANPEMVLGRDP